MSEANETIETNFVTYEVTLPAGDGYRLALDGLARIAGGTVNETLHDIGDPQRIISGRALETLSVGLWQDKAYGVTAGNILNSTWSRGSRVDVLSLKDGTVTLPGFFYAPNAPTDQIGVEPIEDDALEKLVRKRWDEEHMPQTIDVRPRIETVQDDYDRISAISRRRMTVIVGEATSSRLRRYLTGRSLAVHALHGSLGKAFEVLKSAADVVPTESAGPAEMTEWEDDFIAYKDLRAKASAELSRYGVDKLRETIAVALAAQVRTGQPHSLGEVVVEGVVSNVRWWRDVRYEQIARTSLACLAEAYGDGHPTRQFLEKFRSAEDDAGHSMQA